MFQKTITASLVALTLGATLAGADEADDRKVYPGAACWPTSYSNVQGITRVSRISNFTSVTQRVECPVINDRIQAGWASALIRVKGHGVRCWGRAVGWSGEVYLTPRRTSSASTTTLDLGSSFFEEVHNDAMPSSEIFANYVITCELPPYTSVERYYVREK